MRMTVRILCGAVLAGTARSGLSDRPPRLSLEDCLRIGVERNASLANARIDERIADIRIRQVRAQILPHLTASGNLTQVEDVDAFEFGDLRVEAGRKSSWSASAEISQLLYAGGSARAALGAAQAYRSLAEDRVAQRKAELIREIKVGYWGVLLAEEAVRIRESAVRQWERFLGQTEERFRRGDASEFDRISARVRLANERPQWTEAVKNRDLARLAFRNLIRLDTDDFELAPDTEPHPPLPPLPPLVRAGHRNRPELRQLEQRARLQAAEIRAEQGGFLPEFRLRAAYQGRNPPGLGSSENDWKWGWNAGLSAEWRIFDGDRRRATVAGIRMEQKKTQADLEEAERAVEAQIRQAWRRLEHAMATLSAQDETVVLAEKSRSIAQTRFETGLSTALEFADAQLAFDVAQFNRLQSRLALRVAMADLEYATGMMAREWNRAREP